MLKLPAAVAALLLVVSGAFASDESLAEKVQRLEQQVRELQAQLAKMAPAPSAASAAPAGGAPAAANLAAPSEPKPEPNGAHGNGKNGWLWSAYLDGYYGYNFNHPANRANQARAFDTGNSQFNLNYSELVLEHPAEPLGFRVDLGFGQAADIVHAAEPSGLSLFRHLQQAYVSYKAPVGKGLVVDFGKFVTALGAEVIESRDNYNYSRSLLFSYAIPYYHFGLRATYPLTPKLTVGAHIINGWNNVTDDNSGKTYHGTATWTPYKRLSITQNLIAGPENKDTNRGRRTVSDTVVTVQANNKLAFLGNYDYGMDRPSATGFNRVHWTGVSGAARCSLNSWLAVAPRLEWYDDRDGFTTGAPQHVKEGTMTFEFKLHDGLVSRLEYRRDWSNQPFFDRGGRPASARQQSTIVAGLLFYFASPR